MGGLLTTKGLEDLAKELSVPLKEGVPDISNMDAGDLEDFNKALEALGRVQSAREKGHPEYIKALSSKNLPKKFQSTALKKALYPKTLISEGGEDPRKLSESLIKHLDPNTLEDLWQSLQASDLEGSNALKSHMYLTSVALDKPIKGAPTPAPHIKPFAKALIRSGRVKDVLKEDGSFDLNHVVESTQMDALVESMTNEELTESLGGSEGANGPLCDALLGVSMHPAGKTWIRQHLGQTLQMSLKMGMPEFLTGKGKRKTRDEYLAEREQEADDGSEEPPTNTQAKAYNEHLDKSVKSMQNKVKEHIEAADFGWGQGNAESKAKKVRDHEARSWIEEMLKYPKLRDQHKALLQHVKTSESPWEELLKRNDPPLFNVKASISSYSPTNLGRGSTHLDILRSASPLGSVEMSISRKGALQVTADLDRLADLFTQEAGRLGVPVKIAEDFAARCDMLAEVVEKTAGVLRDADGNLVTASEASDIGKPTTPVEKPAASSPAVIPLGDQKENSEVLGMASKNSLTEVKTLMKAANEILARIAKEEDAATALPVGENAKSCACKKASHGYEL